MLPGVSTAPSAGYKEGKTPLTIYRRSYKTKRFQIVTLNIALGIGT